MIIKYGLYNRTIIAADHHSSSSHQEGPFPPRRSAPVLLLYVIPVSAWDQSGSAHLSKGRCSLMFSARMPLQSGLRSSLGQRIPVRAASNPNFQRTYAVPVWARDQSGSADISEGGSSLGLGASGRASPSLPPPRGPSFLQQNFELLCDGLHALVLDQFRLKFICELGTSQRQARRHAGMRQHVQCGKGLASGSKGVQGRGCQTVVRRTRGIQCGAPKYSSHWVRVLVLPVHHAHAPGAHQGHLKCEGQQSTLLAATYSPEGGTPSSGSRGGHLRGRPWSCPRPSPCDAGASSTPCARTPGAPRASSSSQAAATRPPTPRYGRCTARSPRQAGGAARRPSSEGGTHAVRWGPRCGAGNRATVCMAGSNTSELVLVLVLVLIPGVGCNVVGWVDPEEHGDRWQKCGHCCWQCFVCPMNASPGAGQETLQTVQWGKYKAATPRDREETEPAKSSLQQSTAQQSIA